MANENTKKKLIEKEIPILEKYYEIIFKLVSKFTDDNNNYIDGFPWYKFELKYPEFATEIKIFSNLFLNNLKNLEISNQNKNWQKDKSKAIKALDKKINIFEKKIEKFLSKQKKYGSETSKFDDEDAENVKSIEVALLRYKSEAGQIDKSTDEGREALNKLIDSETRQLETELNKINIYPKNLGIYIRACKKLDSILNGQFNYEILDKDINNKRIGGLDQEYKAICKKAKSKTLLISVLPALNIYGGFELLYLENGINIYLECIEHGNSFEIYKSGIKGFVSTENSFNVFDVHDTTESEKAYEPHIRVKLTKKFFNKILFLNIYDKITSFINKNVQNNREKEANKEKENRQDLETKFNEIL
jgi:hypothetical protein